MSVHLCVCNVVLPVSSWIFPSDQPGPIETQMCTFSDCHGEHWWFIRLMIQCFSVGELLGANVVGIYGYGSESLILMAGPRNPTAETLLERIVRQRLLPYQPRSCGASVFQLGSPAPTGPFGFTWRWLKLSDPNFKLTMNLMSQLYRGLI